MSTSDSTRIAEGFYNRDNYTNAIYNSLKQNELNLPPVFQRWVVLETIFDPNIIDENKISQLEVAYGKIRNAKYALNSSLPRNSILAKPIFNSRSGNKTLADINIMFLFPLFSSALAMPCKAGEHVWVMFESLTQQQNLGYWISSIVGPGHVDDVNHSHPPREFERTFLVSEENTDASTKHQGKVKKPRYHFKNGVYTEVIENESALVSPESFIISGDSEEYERIITQSDSGKLSVFESIPRFRKRPGDIALEGSNNALIVLGRDRTGELAQYQQDPNTGANTVANEETINPQFIKRNAGAIDIVTGRGQKPLTSGQKVINHLQNEELAKDKNSVTQFQNEGNPDFLNDRSRIYISQNTKVDEALGLTTKNSSKNPAVTDSANGDAGIIIKSDKVRIFARSDVQILVTGYAEEDVTYSEGEYEPGLTNDENQTLNVNRIKTEKNETKKWASITIKSNGDIVFEPSDMGYIKLGGDDANKGIVCTSQPVVASNGGVAGSPLLTTDGGQVAGSTNPSPTGNIPALPQTATLDLGTYSNKVLIK